MARDRVGEGPGVLVVALQEAPARLAVIGEGLAALIGQTSGLAGLQVDILAGLQILAVIIHPLHHHQAAPASFGLVGHRGASTRLGGLAGRHGLGGRGALAPLGAQGRAGQQQRPDQDHQHRQRGDEDGPGRRGWRAVAGKATEEQRMTRHEVSLG